MADVQIESSAYTALYRVWNANSLVYISETVGYMFYLQANGYLVYKKTENSGATWSAQVPVSGGVLCTGFEIWFDKWGPGDAGDIIHIGYVLPGTNTVNYKSLDTSDDTLGSAVVIYTGAGFYAMPYMVRTVVGITKSRAGNLYIGFWARTDQTLHKFFKSENDGASWNEKTDMANDDTTDYIILMPGNETDTDDIWCIYEDYSAGQIYLKVYDQSENSWSETLIGACATQVYTQFRAVQRHSDNHVLLCLFNIYNNAAADLKFYDIGSAASIVEKTDVLTDSDDSVITSITLDQGTDDIYVSYLRGTQWALTIDACYKKSDDGGTNWGSEVKFSENINDDHRALWAAISCGGNATGGRFQLVWFNDDLNDLLTNTNNSIEIEPGAIGASIDAKADIKKFGVTRTLTAKGEHHDFVERFIDTTYKDDGNTTAYWDITRPGIIRSPKQGEGLP